MGSIQVEPGVYPIGEPGADTPWKRHINRWHLEKADPKLKMSPPKQPIVWYIEHTTPVKFRRYVREGIEMWNDALAEVRLLNAVEVYPPQKLYDDRLAEKAPIDAESHVELAKFSIQIELYEKALRRKRVASFGSAWKESEGSS